MQFKRMRYTKIEVECLLLYIIPTERALKKKFRKRKMINNDHLNREMKKNGKGCGFE